MGNNFEIGFTGAELAGVQDPFCCRALQAARMLAEHCVDHQGHLHPFHAIHLLKDPDLRDHQENFFRTWNSNRTFREKFRRFSLPLCHRRAEEMVRSALQLSSSTILTDAHVKRAVVSACLTPLRQSIGSCFATAPAILVQRQHLELFVDDLYELLTKGRMRRVAEGKEYSVPLSPSWGVGDLPKLIDPTRPYWAAPGLLAALKSAGLISEPAIEEARKRLQPAYHPSMTVEQVLSAVIPSSLIEEAKQVFKGAADHALLKAWEFTLASFCDIKTEFSRWNLAWSVGLDPRQAGGIGEAIYQALEAGLQETNRKVEELHQAAAVAFDQLKMTERQLRQASTEDDVRRWRLEEQARVHHFRSCEELRDTEQQKAKAYAEFFPFLIGHYTRLFQNYFQEIYDPEMPEIFSGAYEDRRAGFRLIYKHGRSDSSVWTSIHDGEMFVQSLVDFFTITEPLVAEACEKSEGKKILEEMTTRVIQHVRSDLFLRSALIRAAERGRTPWAYLSGGTLEEWMSIYFRDPSPPSKETREAHDPQDLCVFLLDSLKALPPSITDQFIENPAKRLLIESPTHVFTLLPGLSLFKEGWVDRGFTYTWVRDRLLLPGKVFYEGLQLSSAEQHEILRRLSIAEEAGPMMPAAEFCRRFAPLGDHVQAFFHRALPLIPQEQCQSALQRLLEPWTDQIQLPSSLPRFLLSEELLMIAQEHISDAGPLIERAREIGLAPPICLFADTNWPQRYFAFTVSPASLQLEMWVSDRSGVRAIPLSLVNTWFGKGRESTWVVYTKKL